MAIATPQTLDEACLHFSFDRLAQGVERFGAVQSAGNCIGSSPSRPTTPAPRVLTCFHMLWWLIGASLMTSCGPGTATGPRPAASPHASGTVVASPTSQPLVAKTATPADCEVLKLSAMSAPPTGWPSHSVGKVSFLTPPRWTERTANLGGADLWLDSSDAAAFTFMQLYVMPEAGTMPSLSQIMVNEIATTSSNPAVLRPVLGENVNLTSGTAGQITICTNGKLPDNSAIGVGIRQYLIPRPSSVSGWNLYLFQLICPLQRWETCLKVFQAIANTIRFTE